MTSRREFLKTTAWTAAASGLAAAGLASTALAAEPIKRRQKSPFMKLSLAAYSFNRFLPRNWPTTRDGNPTMTLLDFIDFCAEQNLDACELTSYYFPAVEIADGTLTSGTTISVDAVDDAGSQNITSTKAVSALKQIVPHDFLMQVKARTYHAGLDISGTAIGNDFCVPEGEKRDFQLQMTRQWIDYSAIMGAPVIRIFAGNVPRGDDEAAALDRCVSAINESLKYAAKKGVVLALENHGGITATPEQLLAIVDRVDESPWFGVNFDSGNFRTADPYGDLEKIAPYAVNAQLKVSIHPEGKPEERADMGRLVQILKDVGYRGYVVLEYEEKDDPKESIPKVLDELREAIA
jgi:sugar phosphate isomerase/epimerase